MGNRRNVTALALTYVGTVVGAGFASGQELLYFFVRFGSAGLWGTWLAGLGFMVLGAIIFQLAHTRGITSYHLLLNYLLGRKLGPLADLWLSLYLFAGLVIMLAGCGALFEEYLSLPGRIGVGLSSLILMLFLFRREQGVLAFNLLLVPAIIGGAFLIAVLAGGGGSSSLATEADSVSLGWIVSVILYVSYNMISGLVLLVKFSDGNGATGLRGVVVGGLLLGILAWMLTKVLLENYQAVGQLEVPLLYLAHREGAWLGYGYGIVLWLAMLTTAVVNGGGLAFRLSNEYLPYSFLVTVLLAMAALLSNAGFSLLVRTLYPLFGYLNLVVMTAVLYRYFRAC